MLKSSSSNFEQISENWEKQWNSESNNDLFVKSLPESMAPPTGWQSEIYDGPLDSELSKVAYSENLDDFQKSSFSTEEEYLQEIPIQNMRNSEEKQFTEQRAEDFLRNAERKTPPIVLHRKMPNNQVTYQQNVSVRYLQPPTPPPPGPIIIREVRAAPPPSQPPIRVRQRPIAPPTPPPIIIRQRPPPEPEREPTRIIEKVLPSACPSRRRLIVEEFAPAPPKPADIVIERWLPYRNNCRKRILYEREPQIQTRQEPNLLILHDRPRTRIEKEFINQGVVKVDPQSYVERYGPELRAPSEDIDRLIEDATRSAPPPETLLSAHDKYRRTYSPIQNRSSHIPSYHSDYYRGCDRSYSHYDSRYDRPPGYCEDRYNGPSSYCEDRYNRPSSYCEDRYNRPSSYCEDRYDRQNYSYDDRYPRSSIPTMVDVTSSWNRHCYSSNSGAQHSPRTFHVKSDRELNNVLEDLTHDQRIVSFNSY